MGYYGRLDLKSKAQELRKNGSSYREIIATLHIPKSTVSDWCKEVVLTDAQLKKLYQNKKTGALKGSIVAAKHKQNIRKKNIFDLFNKGLKEIGTISKRDRFIAGAAFYSSEGTKTDRGCAIANSDPFIIKFMVNWFKEFGSVPDYKFRAAIWLHSELDEILAKKYWSEITTISLDQFYKTYIVVMRSGKTMQQKNQHIHGICTIYVSDVLLKRRINGWIGGILQKPMV